MIPYEDICRALDAFRQRKQHEAELAALDAAGSEAPGVAEAVEADTAAFAEHPASPEAAGDDAVAAGESSVVEVSDAAIIHGETLADDSRPGIAVHEVPATSAAEPSGELDEGGDEEPR